MLFNAVAVHETTLHLPRMKALQVVVPLLNAKFCAGDLVQFPRRSNLTQVANDPPSLRHFTSPPCHLITPESVFIEVRI